MSEIESRRILKSGTIEIRVSMVEDTDGRPEDAECYSPADIAAWKADHWQYVGLVATVSMHGVVLGTDSLWGIEYGQLADVTADPWEDVAAVVDGHTVTMGSPLWNVISAACAAARENLAKLGSAGDALAEVAKKYITE